MARDITAQQSRVLDFCRQFYAENDQLPPMHVIASHFGWASENTVHGMLSAIRHKGYIERNILGKYRFTAKGRRNTTPNLNNALISDER